MRTRPRWALLSLGALIVFALFTFPTWWPLVARGPTALSFLGAPDAERPLLETIQAVDPTQAAALYAAGTPTVVPEETQQMPEMELPVIVARGEFTELDALHRARGSVTLFRSGAEVIMRFEDFEVRNGPDLRVLLSTHAELSADIAVGAVEVGPLIGSQGDQNYIVPEDVDISLYKSVVLYSRAFDVVFSIASLVSEEF